jgi:hypothetical protein
VAASILSWGAEQFGLDMYCVGGNSGGPGYSYISDRLIRGVLSHNAGGDAPPCVFTKVSSAKTVLLTDWLASYGPRPVRTQLVQRAIADESYSSPGSLARGASLSLSTSVTNVGSASTGTITVYYYLSQSLDPTSTNRVYIGQSQYSSISSASSALLTASHAVPSTAPTGAHYVLALWSTSTSAYDDTFSFAYLGTVTVTALSMGSTCSSSGACASGSCIGSNCCNALKAANCVDCDVDGDCATCAAGYYRTWDWTCAALQSMGSTCSSSGVCASGSCIGSNCCNALKAANCVDCDVDGDCATCAAGYYRTSSWTCAPVSDDDSTSHDDPANDDYAPSSDNQQPTSDSGESFMGGTGKWYVVAGVGALVAVVGAVLVARRVRRPTQGTTTTGGGATAAAPPAVFEHVVVYSTPITAPSHVQQGSVTL